MQEKVDLLRATIGNKRWRLSHIYKIENKFGGVEVFKPNQAQEALLDNAHYLNIILKARQLGFSTLIDIEALDTALFSKNQSIGIIADTLDNAKALLANKIKFAYRQLDPRFAQLIPKILKSNETSMEFSNGSSIRVGASLRSGTYNFLHISEYGKICTRTPLKAREVKTGSLNTIAPKQRVYIESTAEGQEGDYFDKCQVAENRQLEGAEDGEMDYRFHFFPWYLDPAYISEERPLSDKQKDYFRSLAAEHGIELTPEQKYWYAAKQQEQGDDMKREFPSIPAEAFEASVEGSYYKRQMTWLRENNRLVTGLYDPSLPVETIWDLGVGDPTAIWFRQRHRNEYRYIDYYYDTGEGIKFYIDVLKRRGYTYSEHIAPHDIEVREWGTGVSRIETARKLGLNFSKAANIGVDDGIDAVRTHLLQCVFDKEKCAEGIKCLDNYRKEWDDNKGIFRDKPYHDWASHGSDAFRYGAIGEIENTMDIGIAAGMY